MISVTEVFGGRANRRGCLRGAARSTVSSGSSPRIGGGERGATMIEATVVLPFFLLFLLSAFWCCILVFNALSLEFALARAAREVITIGQSGRLAEVKARVKNRAAELGVDLDESQIFVCLAWQNNKDAVPPAAPCGTQNAGRPNDAITITVYKRLPVLFFAESSYPINASVTVRNEPFTEL